MNEERLHTIGKIEQFLAGRGCQIFSTVLPAQETQGRCMEPELPHYRFATTGNLMLQPAITLCQ